MSHSTGTPDSPLMPEEQRPQQDAAKLAPQPATQTLGADSSDAAAESRDVQQASDTLPVGQGDYVVKQGDCISSIARDHGLFWETIWNHPANAELRAVRKNPNVLLPGDRVTLPDEAPKRESGHTELRHRFRRKGEPARLRLRLLDASDQPRSAVSYTLDIDGTVFSGTTDPNGRLEYTLAGNAKSAVLTLSDKGEEEEYILHLGDVNPIDAVTGVQQRLNNLGFACGPVDGILGPRTRAAIEEFQGHYNLEPSGLVDESTRSKLLEVHGC